MAAHKQQISGQLVDLHQRRIFPAQVEFCGTKITRITEVEFAPAQYILPGFVDAHIHIESSMMPPSTFALLAAQHGTVATVSDPHEIANVCGVEGIDFMISNSQKTPFYFFFGAPSCVPATSFETNGASLNSDSIDYLLRDKNIWYLSEMMNYPAVLNRDAETMKMIKSAKRYGKPVDGHAPGLRGLDAKIYASAGITTDHECTTLGEAEDKLNANMHILIREGSAAKNFDALHTLIQTHPEQVMFCSDDKHPDELVNHHIDELVRRSLQLGYDLFDVLRIACVNPVKHYQLPVGLLREGDAADFIVVENLKTLRVIHTVVSGQWLIENNRRKAEFVQPETINNFHAHTINLSQLHYTTQLEEIVVPIIVALNGQLLTLKESLTMRAKKGKIKSNAPADILKIVVVNRYLPTPPAIGFIKGFGLRKGAIGSTVTHDSHNIIVVGVDDRDILAAVQALMKSKGGLCVADGDNILHMPLPIAGLMSDLPPEKIATQYQELEVRAKQLGSSLSAPFMTLSFMALPVIPSLKLTDKGLFDVEAFQLITSANS